MLSIKTRIENFSMLGEYLQQFIDQGDSFKDADDFKLVMNLSQAKNPWFTYENQIQALKGIVSWLNVDSLTDWLSNYSIDESKLPKNIAVVMAGNIPMVNFHDYLAVLISGNILIGKLSSQDSYWLPFISKKLIEINSEWEKRITLTDQIIENFDAVIATGSTNTSRYFEYYFGKYPHIIRKNRNSVAIISGDESSRQFELLGHDIFSYYGLGCRNVSSIFIPSEFPLSKILDALSPFHSVIHHHKYSNNYDYQKAILMVNNEPFLDTGFLIIKNSNQIASPVGVLHFQEYNDINELSELIDHKSEEIQCIVRSNPERVNEVDFGKSQSPGLMDYPDGIDILQFLIS